MKLIFLKLTYSGGVVTMQKTDNLSKLKEGECAVVTNINSDDSMRRRLQDIGLINGTMVTCIQKSPLGDPIAYQIRGAVIALRSEDSSCVKVQSIGSVTYGTE